MSENVANQIPVTNMIANEAVRGLYNESTLLAYCNVQYSDEFAKKVGGAKVGDTVRVKIPYQFIVGRGKAYTPQALQGDTTLIQITEPYGVHVEADLEELALQLVAGDISMSEEVIVPAGRAIGAMVEYDGYSELVNGCNGTYLVDSPIIKSLDVTKAQARLKANLARSNDRYISINSLTNAGITDEFKNLFHTQRIVTEAVKDGEVRDAVGVKWLETQLLGVHTAGVGADSDVTITFPTLSGGAVSFDTVTLGGADAGNVKVGDSIDLGVMLVNAETKTPTAFSAQRTVYAVNGNVVTLSQAVVIDGPRKNVVGMPQTANAKFIGTAGAEYSVDVVWQKDCITFANPDLAKPKSIEEGWRTDGKFSPNISMLFTSQFWSLDISTHNRFDLICGWKVLRPEWGVRIWTPLA